MVVVYWLPGLALVGDIIITLGGFFNIEVYREHSRRLVTSYLVHDGGSQVRSDVDRNLVLCQEVEVVAIESRL